MNVTLIISILTLVAIAIGLISFLVTLYNSLVALQFNVKKSFANIDVVLKQRADEIPNLIKVVKEHQHYEESTLEKLTQLRSQYLNATSTEDKVKYTNKMEGLLKSVWAVAENYPDLKASQGFVTLQERVSQLEDIITDRREFYNDSVNLYNIGIHEFPNLIMARLMNYKDKALLQISEAEKQYDGVQF